eukprot:gi/632934951/ref/XP_007887126.1/ PREDICTED: inactive N-acetylated-alpha-linked acidic dipeptidase-like protein 2 [Callorhinchus milii]
MAYRKVDQKFSLRTHDVEPDELPIASLELEWDMEKELEESAFDDFGLEDSSQPHVSNSTQNTDLDMEFIQPSTSPRGRFERLQEEASYHTAHHLRQGPNHQPSSFYKKAKLFTAAIAIFICGLLIGYYGRKVSTMKKLPNNGTAPSPTPSTSTVPPDDNTVLQEIVQEIGAESIKILFRNFAQLAADSDSGEGSAASHVMEQWAASGLMETRLVNYTVLLSLPDAKPNRITLTNSSQCFYPNGQQCSPRSSAPRGEKGKRDLLGSYAAYSANGSLEAELVDVQYGTVDDLLNLRSSTNFTQKIALVKLGQAPLLYKLSLLLEAGFGGALVYVDPCDSPQNMNTSHETFWISLNPGGDPSTQGYPSIDGSFREYRPNLTSLLVQPISAVLAKELLSSNKMASGSGCVLLANSSSDRKTVRLEVGTVADYKTIQNVIGRLKGSVNPDKYVIVGSHHGNGEELWPSSASIVTEIIQAVMSHVRQRGWHPNRSILFCSWGGTAFGSIGSHEWAEEMEHVLQVNAVAYVNLFKPVLGNGILHTVASPSLRQLAADVINTRFSLNCTRQEKCSGAKVHSAQVEGNNDFFINHLGVPTVQFAYLETKTPAGPGFISEALWARDVSVVESLDPSFRLHETVAKLTAEMILRIANEPVLPFNVLDVALVIQEQLKGEGESSRHMLAFANALRESAQLFQSNEMRPANDPKERDAVRLRMLNNVLQNLEKNFIIQQVPPGYYRNILYRLDEGSNQFSVVEEAFNHHQLQQTNQTLNTVLSKVMNSIRAAQAYVKAGLEVFENIRNTKKHTLDF